MFNFSHSVAAERPGILNRVGLPGAVRDSSPPLPLREKFDLERPKRRRMARHGERWLLSGKNLCHRRELIIKVSGCIFDSECQYPENLVSGDSRQLQTAE